MSIYIYICKYIYSLIHISLSNIFPSSFFFLNTFTNTSSNTSAVAEIQRLRALACQGLDFEKVFVNVFGKVFGKVCGEVFAEVSAEVFVNSFAIYIYNIYIYLYTIYLDVMLYK